MRYYHTPARMAKIKISDFSASEDVEKLKPSYLAAGAVKWCSPCGTVWQFLPKLNTEFL